jgi:UDP-N-acetylglucosamine 2-epimerase
LLEEKVNPVNIAVTGNTVIDSLLLTLDQLSRSKEFQDRFYEKYPFAKTHKKLILVTGHRRENFGQGLANTCSALLELSQRDDVEIVYPVHLNPNVKKAVHESLGGHDNIHLIPPMDYNEFVYLMRHAYLVVTDSGGIQEEAPSLGKPVLVTRDTTERPEAVQAGTVELVGTDRARILSAATLLLEDEVEYQKRSSTQNPYGDGKATLKILEKLYDHFGPMDHSFQLVPPTIYTVVKLLQ